MGTSLKSCFSEVEVIVNLRTILGSQMGKWITFAVVVAVFAALLTAGVVRAQEDSTTIKYAENGTAPVVTLTATDPEGATITWSLLDASGLSDVDPAEGLVDADIADQGQFMIKDGVLTFSIGGVDNSPPDFENPRARELNPDSNTNTYKVVVVASDAGPDGTMGYRKVTVEVTNVAEAGKVAWTVDPDGAVVTTLRANEPPAKPIMQFQVGATLAATVTDGDINGEITARWQWYRSSSKTSEGTAIPGDAGNSATYTVKAEDVGSYLRAVAYYTEESDPSELKTPFRVSDYLVLAAAGTGDDPPEFEDGITREVDESDKGMAVGTPVTADEGHGVLNYTLGTDNDNGKFVIDQKTGQITTSVKLNHETSDVASDGVQCETTNVCSVSVTATDSAGRTATATVTITIVNVDEPPAFLQTGNETPEVAENTTAVTGKAANDDDDYGAMDPESSNVNLLLMGADRTLFNLTGANDLTFETKPDFENPTDANKDNVYEVTVRATDGKLHTDRMVRVTVTSADDPPVISEAASPIKYAENGTAPVVTLTATDPEGATITWSLLDASGLSDVDPAEGLVDADIADQGQFMIKDGVLTFSIGGVDNSPPDFENPRARELNPDSNTNTYKVVVVASDAGPGAVPAAMMGYRKVTVEVTNVAEAGKVAWTVDPDGAVVTTLRANEPPAKPIMQFQVGATLAATVTDGDINEEITATWQWHRSSSKNSQGTRITTDGTSATYTVKAEDEGRYLRVVAYYFDEGTPPVRRTPFRVSDYRVLAAPGTGDDLPEFEDGITREVDESDKGHGSRHPGDGGRGPRRVELHVGYRRR